MVTRTFLSKCTTIFMDSEDNFGLHPIGMLNRGLIVSRALIKFDTDKISSRMLDGTYLNRNDLKHVLKLYNCGSIDNKKFGNPIPSNDYNGEKIRNTSFSIIVFPIPKEWDRGVGFDNSDDIWFVGNSKKSTQGCNWYQAKNGVLWDNEGIISTDQLRVEYTKYLNGEDSIIIASQHFDYGNEDFSIDITDYVNDIVDGKIKDNGLCICFAPTDDADDDKITKYTGFFTDKTNTFYEPYLESKYDEIIFDDRNNFKIGKANKLYLYVNIEGEPENLDELPICKIDENEYPVTHQGKGIYYATVLLSKNEYSGDEILVDEWSNLKYAGSDLEAVEMEFITKPYSSTVSIGKTLQKPSNGFIVLSGINGSEKLDQGEIRNVEITMKMPYTGIKKYPDSKMYYRVYVKDAFREIDVIDWDGVNVTPDINYFTIDTSELLPQTYHVDIKIGKKEYKDELKFIVVNNASKQNY